MTESLDEKIARLFPDATGEQMPLPAPVLHHVSHSPSSMRDTLRPAVKCHGGKFYLAHHIHAITEAAGIKALARKEIYGGGGNWLIQSKQIAGQVEIYNDYDPLFWNVYNCFSMAGRSIHLLDRLRHVGCRDEIEMRQEWAAAKQVCETMYQQERRSLIAYLSQNHEAAIGLACACIVYRRMSSGGMGKVFSWQDRDRGGQPGEINSWKNFVYKHAPTLAQRCSSWVCVCQDGAKLCAPDAPDGGVMDESAIFYIDPPYRQDDRTAKTVYGRFELVNTSEMLEGKEKTDRAAHTVLLETIQIASAKVIVSSYENELYDKYLNADNGWIKHLFAVPNHSGRGEKKNPRVECVYTNF